ncbi:MAG: Lon protease family protein [Salinibacter sp.]|uniref:Lon protease family protein n=1 Tax=Salinibacter sp. TaxID=2065818 RepID=UPI0035D4A850
MIDPLAPDALRQRFDPSDLDFDTTDDLPAETQVVGQDRAIEALDFGMNIDAEGYNVFALGPAGTGRRELVQHLLEEEAAAEETPPDWCYVNNFDDEREPRALTLPAGRGCEFKEDVDQLIENLQTALPATFESEEYQSRREMIQEEVREDQEAALEDLQERARQEGIALIRTPQGFVFTPIRDGEVIPPEEVESMPEEERQQVQEQIEEYQDELQQILRKVPEHQREARQRVEELNKEMAALAIDDLIDALREKYADLDDVLEFLDNVRSDLIENVDFFVQAPQQGADASQQGQAPMMQQQGQQGGGQQAPAPDGAFWRRYRVNLIVDNEDTEGAPVVYEDNPNYQNLVGQVEQIAQMGALVTDFNLIRPGALHEANGGYLIVEARQLLTQPYAWEGLKRALRNSEIQIESPGQALGLIRTLTLEPEAIPLDVKLVVVGERLLYYLLDALDPDMERLFKVMADFDDQIDRIEEQEAAYADLLATTIEDHDLQPFDRSAVARVMDRSVRLVSDTEKLSAEVEQIRDLLKEAHHWAQQDEADVVTDEHVQQAIDAQIYRADRLRERVQESIEREQIYIDTDGATIGQVNGLSYLEAGGFSFGRPNRITARVRLGDGEIVDIERETALGGAIHSKGVLILSGFLQGRFAQRYPLSLSASLVFEQSYGGIDGDSASSAELYALLSALAEVPLKQTLAVTGSVNQRGVVQPIGGVNEKIEGFFDVCKERGLTGDQGVLIPASNTDNLMLRPDVVAAAEADDFHVYPVETIDQGIELLTGMEAGTRDEQGAFPDDTINGRVEARLREFADRRRQFAMTDGQADAPQEA